MRQTVEFYTQVLGMRLIKTIDLPGGSGQHFFFDMGGGNALAFFWFPDAPDAVPGVSAPVTVPGLGEWTQRGRLDEPHRVQRAGGALP